MKIKKNKNSRKKILYALLLIVPALSASIWAYFYFQPKESPIGVVEQSDDGASIDQTPDRLSGEDLKNKEETINSDPSSETPDASSGKVVITATQEGDSVTVISKLYAFSSGTCALQVSNGGKTYTDTATIIYQPSYSTCAGFSIPVAELGKGTWNIKITAKLGSDAKDETTSIVVK